MTTTPDIRLVPKTDEKTARWLPVAMAAYEQARIHAGDDPGQAAAARRSSEEQFFPDGRLVAGHFLFTVTADGEDAGWLWIGPMEDGANWYVWDVAVHEAFRGRGIGRATMRLAEEFARSQGADALRLNVFTYNTAAIRLYERLGFTAGAMHMLKRL
jgi:ribosomal protein S18 acetylase RimI-like enzyme